MASVGDVCKKDLAFDRCLRSVDAERNRGNSVILFAPCFVLADGAGTDLALALVAGGGSVWPVERLQRLVGIPRFGQQGQLWIEEGRWVSRGPLRSPALLRPSPVLVSRGCWRFVAGRWITRGVLEPMVPCGTVSPLFCLAEDSMSGSQIPASDVPQGGPVLRIGSGLYRRPERLASRCAEGLRARSCAVRRKPRPDAVGRDVQVRPTASGRGARFAAMFWPGGLERGAAYSAAVDRGSSACGATVAAGRRRTARNGVDRAPSKPPRRFGARGPARA